MDFDVQTQGADLVLRAQNSRIDAAVAVQFKDRLLSLAAGRMGRVLLDLSRVDFLDSSGLGALVAVRRMLEGRSLELITPTGPVLRVLRLTRMDTVFPIHADPAAPWAPPHG